MGDQFQFSSKLDVIGKMLDDWNVSHKTKEEAIEKYNKLWEKKYGNKVMPLSFYNLPKTLRGDCTVDIFWYCFKHSHLLRDLDFAVLKNLSLRMKHEFYMPGEYLYKCNQFKTKMFYIASGVVEVIGRNERGSPIISFSDGTVLGEISCLMALKSIVNLRCATYTNVQTVDIKSLARLMLKHHGVNKELKRKLNLRLQLAREMQNSELVKFKSRAQKRTSVRWIKQQWRSIYSENKPKGKTTLEERYQQVTEYHTSRFIGLYVLSDDVEMLKKRVICLRSSCPYLLEPSSSFRKFCDYFVLATIIIQSLLLPYLCFFVKRLSYVQNGWLYMLDVVFIFGLYLDMSTVVKSHKKILMKVSEIIIYKGKQINTLVDIFSIIPLEILSSLMAVDSHTMTVLRLNRVLRVYKVFWVIQHAELNVWIGYIQIRLVKYFLLFSYSIYFASCVMYGITCYSECDPYGWLSYNVAIRTLLYPNMTTTKRATTFLLSLDYTATRLLSLTWGHTYAYSISDIILEHFTTLWGYYLFSFCFAELAACSVLQLEVRVTYQKYIKDLKNFASKTRIPSYLKKFMYNMVTCNWHYNRRYQITGPDSIIKDMPENLKTEILTNRIIRCLKSVPFFLEVEDEFIRNVANIADLNVFPPSTVILREDIPVTVLNVIVRGYCTAESSIPTDKYHKYVNTYAYADCFPIMELFLGVNSFLKVVSITTVELISINLRELMVCIRSREKLNRDLERVLTFHMKSNYIVLTRQKGRLPALITGQKSLGKSDYFGYDINDKIKADEHKIIFKKAFDKLGKYNIK
ncbi:cyclic nucleotide-gated cation channel subunit a [Holotrichia oblita]|uniref:Cyclic nucleotide-gated cation channel subunit a n=1 Tax=Holotrichia oblita TaxID=644536 RepID=A0ACB9SW45_HOLOL|nr:cyclic nucleotide-gated cation channel subunit a [Holotrichia oblita]